MVWFEQDSSPLFFPSYRDDIFSCTTTVVLLILNCCPFFGTRLRLVGNLFFGRYITRPARGGFVSTHTCAVVEKLLFIGLLMLPFYIMLLLLFLFKLSIRDSAITAQTLQRTLPYHHRGARSFSSLGRKHARSWIKPKSERRGY